MDFIDRMRAEDPEDKLMVLVHFPDGGREVPAQREMTAISPPMGSERGYIGMSNDVPIPLDGWGFYQVIGGGWHAYKIGRGLRS